MAEVQRNKSRDFPWRLYGRLCGRELEANIFHFQFLPAYHARRHIRRDRNLLRGRVLDVGCGNQPYLPYLDSHLKYIALDYPPACRGLAPRVPPTVYGDARGLPFGAGSFDGVLCFQVLEHVDEPERVIRELARVLKPGGVALISVPFFYNLHLEPYDFFRFSPYGIRSLLEKNGFLVRDLRRQGGIGTLLVQLFHNWLFSSLAQRLRRRRPLIGLLGLLVPFLLGLTALGNLLALLLDRLDGQSLRFAPNLWLVAEKTADSAPPQKEAHGHGS